MKEMNTNLIVIPNERIIRKIYWLRGKRVMLDADLAELYEVETKAFNQAVKRNIERFPEDFMFQLNPKEAEVMRSQFVTASKRNVRYVPLAFTEQGVAMLSSVLKSKRAVQINIHIMRVFTQMREMLLTHKDLRDKIERMERKYDKQFRAVFEAIKRMLDPKVEPIGKIGFEARKKKQ